LHVSQATIDATEAWLADPDKPAPLRRLIAEGRDGIVRAAKGRARDAAEN
jgi:aminopeptidase N